MVELTITPNLSKKTAKIVGGLVAAGEHVFVTIKDGGALVSEDLRLRLMIGPHTVAIFPCGEDDAWVFSDDDVDATCIINLNTKQFRRLCVGPQIGCAFVLEDTNVGQLYFVAPHYACGWPRGRGDEELIDIDAGNATLENVSEQLRDAVNTLTSHVSNTNNPHQVTKQSVGLGNVDNTSDLNKPVSTAQASAIANAKSDAISVAQSESARSINAESGLLATINSERALRIEDTNDIRAKIAFLNAAVATIHGVDFRSVLSLPDVGESFVCYLVPADDAADGDVKDEYIWIDGAWEKIGSTRVSLDGFLKFNEPMSLTSNQMEIARLNIGAGTSSFSGSYNDLTDKPEIPEIRPLVDDAGYSYVGTASKNDQGEVIFRRQSIVSDDLGNHTVVISDERYVFRNGTFVVIDSTRCVLVVDEHSYILWPIYNQYHEMVGFSDGENTIDLANPDDIETVYYNDHEFQGCGFGETITEDVELDGSWHSVSLTFLT